MPELSPDQFKELARQDQQIPPARSWSQRLADRLLNVMSTKEKFR